MDYNQWGTGQGVSESAFRQYVKNINNFLVAGKYNQYKQTILKYPLVI